MDGLNEGRFQVKRKYADHGRIRINENGAKVRDTIIKYIGNNYVTEEDLHNHLIRLEEDRGGIKVNKVKWFARNQKLFTTFEKKGTTYYSLSKYGKRILELINNKNTKKAINESSFRNIPSLSEWIAINEGVEDLRVKPQIVAKILTNPKEFGDEAKLQTYIDGNLIVYVDTYFYGGDRRLQQLKDSWSEGGHFYEYFVKEHGMTPIIEDSFLEVNARGRHKKLTTDGIVGVVLSFFKNG